MYFNTITVIVPLLCHAGAITTPTTSFIIGVVIATVSGKETARRYSELNTVVAWPGKLHRLRVSVSLSARRANKKIKKRIEKV